MKQLHRWKLYFDKDLEESWLNQLAQQGWGMSSFCLGRYTFEPIEPGEYIYRVDLLPSDEEKKQEYFSLLREMGVEVVQQWGFWFFCRRRVARAPSKGTATRPPKPATTAASPGCFFWLRWKLSAGLQIPAILTGDGQINLAAMVLLAFIGRSALRQDAVSEKAKVITAKTEHAKCGKCSVFTFEDSF